MDNELMQQKIDPLIEFMDGCIYGWQMDGCIHGRDGLMNEGTDIGKGGLTNESMNEKRLVEMMDWLMDE